MFRSIYSRFILGYVLFGLVSFLAIALFADKMTYNYLVRQKASALYDEAIYMSQSFEENSYYKGDINASVSGDMRMVANFFDATIWLTNSEGRIILDSSDQFTKETIPGFDPASGPDNYLTGFYHNMFSTDTLSVEVSINHNYSPIGYLIMHYPVSEVMSSKNQILNIIYISASIIFVLSLIILLVFTYYVYLPMRRITTAATEYASGNLNYKIGQHFTNDEVGTLARTLEMMADDLSNSEKYQRDFIANVSHDFRSPLTSIKGYLEAILDGTIPQEKSPDYIKRIISETERLSKLTEGMLTLNSMDRKTTLNCTDFDINRVIRNICNSNENACRLKDINFELTFEREEEMVYADYQKIQQVMYNLVDNAIKFSNKSSAIYISTRQKGKKIFISVKDNGIGIPKDSIKKIWDRFYKSDSSRGRDKTGTGLGLSIVREIVQAHNETIDVVSTEGVGTEFTFSLPVSAD
ncbi:MAG: HAMP domain-containing sensor histidine kinase [Eubacteriales bacterium]|nr:HAMP domain-containing sensor histidine kinase [Eubacteriales bacterium]